MDADKGLIKSSSAFICVYQSYKEFCFERKIYMKLLIRTLVKPNPASRDWLKRLSSLTIKTVKGAAFERKAELSIVLTGDAEVKKLNRQYRSKNKTTDVLSFPLLEGKAFPADLMTVALGDVVVSIPQAKRQALELGKTLKAELALLVVHGVLHLLGYDHATKAQEKKMFALQDSILKKLKIINR
jgi:probable rRNA maturation factor